MSLCKTGSPGLETVRGRGSRFAFTEAWKLQRKVPLLQQHVSYKGNVVVHQAAGLVFGPVFPGGHTGKAGEIPVEASQIGIPAPLADIVYGKGRLDQHTPGNEDVNQGAIGAQIDTDAPVEQPGKVIVGYAYIQGHIVGRCGRGDGIVYIAQGLGKAGGLGRLYGVGLPDRGDKFRKQKVNISGNGDSVHGLGIGACQNPEAFRDELVVLGPLQVAEGDGMLF